MSFGIGVGDIIEVTKIAYTLYNHVTVGRSSATQHYTQIQHSLHALTFALKNLSNQAHTLISSSSPSENDVAATELSEIIKNCKEDLQSVDDFLKKYLLVAETSPQTTTTTKKGGKQSTSIRYTLRANYAKIKFSATQEKEITSLNTRLRGQIDAINLLVQTALLNNQQTSSTAQIALSKAHEAGLKKLEEAVAGNPALEKMEEVLTLLRSLALHAAGGGGVLGTNRSESAPPPTYEDANTPLGGVHSRGMGGMGIQSSRDMGMESTPNIHITSFNAMLSPPSDMPPIQPRSNKKAAAFTPMMAKTSTPTASISSIFTLSTPEKQKKSSPSYSSANEYYNSSPFEIFDSHQTPHTDAATAYASSAINKRRTATGKKEYDMWMYSHHRSSSFSSATSDISIDATGEDVLLDSIGTYLSLIRDCTLPPPPPTHDKVQGISGGNLDRVKYEEKRRKYETTVKKYVNLNHLLSKKWIKNIPNWNETEKEEKRRIALDMLLSLNDTIRGKSSQLEDDEGEGEGEEEERKMLCTWLKECGVEDVVGRMEGVGKTVMWVKQVEVLEGYLARA